MFKGRRAFGIMRLMGGGGGRGWLPFDIETILSIKMAGCRRVNRSIKGWNVAGKYLTARTFLLSSLFLSLSPSLPSPFLLFRLLPVRKYGCRFENETERGLKGGVDGEGGVVNRLGKGDSCTVSKGNLQRNLVYCRENDGWGGGWGCEIRRIV